eukprot:259352-Pyramimonas_sp.AAC.1
MVFASPPRTCLISTQELHGWRAIRFSTRGFRFNAAHNCLNSLQQFQGLLWLTFQKWCWHDFGCQAATLTYIRGVRVLEMVI